MPSVYKIHDGESIFDVTLATYGSLEQVYKLIQENSDIESIDFDLLSNPGIAVAFDETFITPESQETRQIPKAVVYNNYVVKDAQNIFDLALTLYGNVEKVYEIIQNNSESIPNINRYVLAGTDLNFDPEKIDDKIFIDYINKNKIVICTSNPEVNKATGFTEGFTMNSYY